MNLAIVRWVPRVLGFCFAAFLAIFALDVFEESRGIGTTIVALTIHLIPTWLVLASLAVAWRHEMAGAFLFFLLATSYVAMASSRFPLSTILLIAGPPVVIGASFVFSSFMKKRAHGLRPLG